LSPWNRDNGVNLKAVNNVNEDVNHNHTRSTSEPAEVGKASPTCNNVITQLIESKVDNDTDREEKTSTSQITNMSCCSRVSELGEVNVCFDSVPDIVCAHTDSLPHQLCCNHT